MSTAEPALIVDAVTHRFGDRTALDDCSFAVPAGSVTALVGRNGAGKTTLLRAAAGCGTTVVLSTHAVADLAGVCDHVVVLYHGHVRAAVEVDAALAGHRLVNGAADDFAALDGAEVVELRRDRTGFTALVRIGETVPAGTLAWHHPSLEDLVLAYLRGSRDLAGGTTAAPLAVDGGGADRTVHCGARGRLGRRPAPARRARPARLRQPQPLLLQRRRDPRHGTDRGVRPVRARPAPGHPAVRHR
ncbi:ATP-binding cassette domain-containing protein [Dactylosporangium sp. CS-047395]|uniref:ATP-binding cassette domain-containing protein n=1 Tax=Dactylosporangium sp. CS-047395 TaxID=3239936 RepID=UPI003D932C91